MPPVVNLRHLKDKNLRLQGQISAEELQIESLDELIGARQPMRYDLEVQLLDSNLLVTGKLSMVLNCECARCLKPFEYRLQLDHWICHIPLQGEEAALVVNDCVGLTPYLREDTLLAFPQRPLCEPDCGGLTPSTQSSNSEPSGSPKSSSSAWAELNKLRFDK